ncbi:SDR family NAD(P)-dependent oxidoreductase [Sphingomonas sp. KC8]|uniref:SDR family NAD(P)-dependent oxidoreductase n=1 Tax=Sphingomonas sp. KC8 TaxID=1030157 RepID=UPI000248B8E3|nr:SDR family oxidoreductase [Sphingomonas sp. KC8]ARS26902.1 oxidoreductase [Sphingomonas sp. KC8]
MRVVITGAASGIGRACAELLAAGAALPGDHQLLLADRDAANLDVVARQIGPRAAARVADLAEPDCGERIIDAAIGHMGGIDAVISNAGIIMGGALAELELADFDRIFAINTRASWLLAKAAYPHLKASRGTYVATASMSATQPTPALGFYSASKAALLMMVRQMCIEWGPDGIRCNTVSPGPTYTPMTAAGYADPARRDQREASIPLRKLGMAEDVANAILFLISPAASHVSGIDVLVDGGMSNMLMPASGGGTGQQASR